ncbi:hypothetical protein [Komagataeibacter oboediens]|uniref:Uncharacterized protein n=1 Tax=Komagataeibacter oboediens TaxID=65958 RepID=A0ABS5SMQ8_9PROT|nr:hypothetical protein [Komagataeibacter oboediens]MBL7233186.1 hypothetical protein [Komagataeibacter oboediens]MBT0675469.1 hypothetical protein [Komagataeibacter oboediens]MBT0679716.1 hypothetical protein [Komagataeibacter oboediens]
MHDLLYTAGSPSCPRAAGSRQGEGKGRRAHGRAVPAGGRWPSATTTASALRLRTPPDAGTVREGLAHRGEAPAMESMGSGD